MVLLIVGLLACVAVVAYHFMHGIKSTAYCGQS